MKRLAFFISFSILFFTCALSSTFADTTNLRSIFDDLYQPDKIVEITLQFDIKNLINKKLKQEKFTGSIQYQRKNSEVINYKVEVQSRGNLRLEICEFPLLKLDFSKKDLKAGGFVAEFDELKMITHCNSGKKSEASVLKEWLVYKLYNIITEKSLRAQLLHVRYLDAQGKLYADEMAFIIEPAAALARRLGYLKYNKSLEAIVNIETETYNKMILFQYMIGNADWRITAMHNIEVLEDTISKFNLVVPYDFDYAGMVSAPYAIPNDRAGQKFFGQRVLSGTFKSEADFQNTIKYFIMQEAAIFNTCNNFKLLPNKEREKIITYLQSFFDEIKNPNISMQKLNGY